MVYQAGPRGGAGGRGRGNAVGRGGMNANAQSFSPGSGPAGQKRPREEGSIAGQGNAGKRPRGGGPNN
jgi:nucleoprotein TPR